MIELFLIIIIVAILICTQISLGKSAKSKIDILKSVFNSLSKANENKFETQTIYVPKQKIKVVTWREIKERLGAYCVNTPSNEDGIQVIIINNENEVAKEIENSINTYLIKNKGAVSDFNLIKDIVERNCDAVESEIESVTPLPLYLGLVGTMLGIIVGLGAIGLTTGFGDIQQVVDSLMSEVACAMVASLVGVLTTTFISWKSRKCNVVIEADKNKFYTWIQTELLPVLSSNTVSTLTLLERNLNKFNASFGDTIVKLDEKLSKVGETYEQQLEILRRIENLDMSQMATANVKILKALDSSSKNLEDFAQYMDNSTMYLSEVRKLTKQMDSHLKETESLEIIAEFYKKQMNEIALRQDAIKSSVISVDDTLQKALASLQANAEQGLFGLKQTYVKQQDEMEKLALQQGTALMDKLAKLDLIVELVHEIQSMPKQIGNMEKALNNAIKQSDNAAKAEINAINNLAEAIRKNRISNTSGKTTSRTINEKVSEFIERGGFLSKISNVFKKKKKKSATTIEAPMSENNADSQPKGQWYEQGKQKRITK
ncbi:hypothetical protein AAAT34_07925 [Hallella faecis]|uniref:MotA/TolQ/ExbB proton channel domain-containing protein n=1 Tax=Hallella faecis TaxID=2841596 RepID=A0ABV1FRE2_9BACT|nr:hypothetical protein [Hallella faecis]MBU0290171.1 hypothetical protein [Hallella faecis]